MSAGADSKVKVWDLRLGKLAYTLYGHNGQATCCDFSYQGDYFATGGSDCMILLWNTNWVNSGLESLEDKSVTATPSVTKKKVSVNKQ